MAVLGVGGRLELKRCAPEPCILNKDSFDPATYQFDSICEGYWSATTSVLTACRFAAWSVPWR